MAKKFQFHKNQVKKIESCIFNCVKSETNFFKIFRVIYLSIGDITFKSLQDVGPSFTRNINIVVRLMTDSYVITLYFVIIRFY